MIDRAAYLDNAATTPLHPAAAEAMEAVHRAAVGNPSGSHRLAREAMRVLDDARERMAEIVGCRPGDVIFCGGGTEADNLAVTGVVGAAGGVPVCGTTEHHAVLDPVELQGGRTVGVDARGHLDLAALEAALDDDVSLVSVMTVNNETGVIQALRPVRDVIDRVAPRAVLHTDAVQAAPWLDLADVTGPADLVSLSAHKFGGPAGVGVLVVRNDVTVAPMLLGGGQERGRRSGTHNVAGVAGMMAALEVTVAAREEVNDRVSALRAALVDGLCATVSGTTETGRRDDKIPGNAHVCIDGIESEALLFLLERADVFASAASSCSSGAQEPSHVLAAMGIPRRQARGSVRFSLGATTTAADIDRTLAAVPDAVGRLRARDPVVG